MKRLLTISFIVGYLGILNIGNVCHMLGFGTGSHPLMYMIVWDMFCGWTAYDSRAHVIAEGESQQFYELTPPPWGELHPWGNLGRQHYDSINNHCGRIGLNTLRHTRHEPITRLFVIEECWAKKYNIPDHVWNSRYDHPKDVQKYYRIRTVLLPDGTIVQNYSPWAQHQAMRMFGDNPRLQAEASRSRSLFVIDQRDSGRDMFITPNYGGDYLRSSGLVVGSPLGN